jgi:hypothetical protein
MFASLSFNFPSRVDFVTSVFLCDVPNRPRYVVRSQFINNGVLANTEDTKFRAVSDIGHYFLSLTTLALCQPLAPSLQYTLWVM